MAAEGLVVTQANDATPNIGTLFAGKSFLVVQRVPMRTNFLERIRANGGRIVRLESQADYIIADHVRNDCPPTSLSYTFIEAAITTGALPDINHHRAGPAPGIVRTAGSTVAAPKATRTAFTSQDDRDLWNWVHHYKSLGAHAVKGNEIYKQLEAVNPRHTYQSWRDRYVKRLINKPPEGVDVSGIASAPTVQPGTAQTHRPAVDGTVEDEVFEQESEEAELDPDVLFLLESMEDILNIPAEDLDTVWASLADEESSSHLSADQWKRLYEEQALPTYEARQKKEKRAKPALPVKRNARVVTPEPPEPNAEPTTPELVAMRARAAKERQASPSVSQKRKRQTDTPQGNTNGRKRTKGAQPEVSTNEQPAVNPSNVIDLDLENGDEDGENTAELALPGEEVLPTSELNRAAKAQLIAEASSRQQSQQQAQGDSRTQDTQVANQANGQGKAVSGLQLTEENLAHQQAAHGEKVTRAPDLKETNDNLSDYADYLQDLVKGQAAKRSAQADGGEGLNGAEHEIELESDRELTPVNEIQNGQVNDNGATNVNGNIMDHQGLDEDMNDDIQIDLTLAEPEGGFTFSSQEEAQADGIPVQNAWEPQQSPQFGQTVVNDQNAEAGAMDFSNLSGDVEMEEAPAAAFAPVDHTALDTQGIYAAGQQQPDFSFPSPPLPDLDDEADLPTDPLTKPTQSQNPTANHTTSSRQRNASATPRKLRQLPTHTEPESPDTEPIESVLARLTAKGCSPALLQDALYRTSAQLKFTEVVAMSEKLGLRVPDYPEIWSAEDDAKVGTTDAKIFKELCEKKGWEEYDLRLNFLQDWKANQ